jgi:hypothetical protein
VTGLPLAWDGLTVIPYGAVASAVEAVRDALDDEVREASE